VHLDGAHTLKSTKSCIHWFDQVCRGEVAAQAATASAARASLAAAPALAVGLPSALRVLVYNCSHERNVGEMLSCLFKGDRRQYSDEVSQAAAQGFDAVLFCPADFGRPTLTPLPPVSSVMRNIGVTLGNSSSVTEDTAAAMLALAMAEGKSAGPKKDDIAWQRVMSSAWNALRRQCSGVGIEKEEHRHQRLLGGWSQACKNIDDALALVAREANTSDVQIDVLVTGSLYLVGGVLQRCGWDADVGFDGESSQTP
jgi:hypothetical protein